MNLNSEIKDAVKNDRLIMGSRIVLRNLKNKMLELVIYASNCPEVALKDLGHYSGISGVRLEQFKGNSVQLGEMCGKPFRILMVGVRKANK